MAFEVVCPLAELPERSTRLVHAGGEPICLVRLDGDEVLAVHDTCSHQEYPLHEGWIEGRSIECALHGSMFNLDTGEPDSLPAVKPIPTYATKVADGQVLLDASSPTNGAAPPRH